MATLHLLHGFTGAGKTTFARKLEHDLPAVRFTLDEWMVRLYGHNPPEACFVDYSKRVTDLIWHVATQLLEVEQDVILDFGFWSRASRDNARSLAQAVNAAPKFYCISCSEKLMKERVMKRSSKLPKGALVIDSNAFDLLTYSRSALNPLEKMNHTLLSLLLLNR
ncbi:hypothetical protein C1752_06174 [Acaryochloris thomasi RCC1774]|uniref:ATP-binding protein n=1 Tax=Acaryochloris thomasi RCC1774 TaxID=1764569 RepID=A0A2W1JN32_9CYAN|nr:ATP-binding protein [Acaryochloris thomasi]PZD71554.1 hypothetical protein C1752_06174 [Acaryochloris thomasi RCC1774]